jgi:hypothetical protein
VEGVVLWCGYAESVWWWRETMRRKEEEQVKWEYESESSEGSESESSEGSEGSESESSEGSESESNESDNNERAVRVRDAPSALRGSPSVRQRTWKSKCSQAELDRSIRLVLDSMAGM